MLHHCPAAPACTPTWQAKHQQPPALLQLHGGKRERLARLHQHLAKVDLARALQQRLDEVTVTHADTPRGDQDVGTCGVRGQGQGWGKWLWVRRWGMLLLPQLLRSVTGRIAEQQHCTRQA
jgi:hypothetical protein